MEWRCKICGILGYIGKSKNPKATFDLTNALMDISEIRGTHATGFWACVNNKDKVFYHKEPVKASEFINRKIWKDTANQSLDLLLGHCRYTSAGSGNEKFNKNNHPHVSQDFRVALIHNGRIPEYSYLKKQYPVTTDCDSEILLRIFESTEELHEHDLFLKSQLQKASTSIANLYRVYGLKKIFSEVSYGAMAVALGELLDYNERSLWLFHNEHRSLYLVDLRETLGQFFFCSTQEIFRAAVDQAKIASKLIPMDQGVVKLPSDWIYHFKMSSTGNIEWEKIKVNKVKKYGSWEPEEEVEVPKGEKLKRSAIEVTTNLTADENVIQKPFESSEMSCEPSYLKPKSKVSSYTGSVTCENQDSNYASVNSINIGDIEDIEELCEKGTNLLRAIYTKVHNAFNEGSLWDSDITNMKESLNDILSDLENTKYLIK